MSKSDNFSVNFRVYYEDTDAGKVVYYANYLKFYERARTEFLRLYGINQKELEEKDGVIFVVKKCEVEFLSPAKLDDLILVSVEIKELRGASILIHQKIFRGREILSVADILITSIDSEKFKPARIPKEISLLLSK